MTMITVIMLPVASPVLIPVILYIASANPMIQGISLTTVHAHTNSYVTCTPLAIALYTIVDSK